MKSRIALAVIALCVVVGPTSTTFLKAIECYKCTMSDACNDDTLDLSNEFVMKITGCKACMKRALGPFGNERDCIKTKVGIGCTEMKVYGYTVSTCYCNTDLCNSAEHVIVSMTTAVGFAAFTLLRLSHRSM